MKSLEAAYLERIGSILGGFCYERFPPWPQEDSFHQRHSC
jgi:hypothetical protein